MPHPILDPSLSLQQSLAHHLTYNHFPAVDLRWIPICEKAIEIAANAGFDSDDGFSIDGSVLRVEVGQGKTVGEVMDGLHLWDYVNDAHEAYDVDDDEYFDEPKAGE